MQTEKKENKENDKFTEFLQRNRKIIFTCGGIILLFVLVFIVFIAVQDALNKKAIEEAELFAEKFEELRWFSQDESYTDQINTLLSDMETFAKNKRGIAPCRVYSFIARIHSGREDWVLCEEAWLLAADKGNKTYMAPIAFFNAAAAAEEQGKIEKAIEYLQKSVEHPQEFIAEPRARFNIGRLYEKLGNTEAAKEAYRAILVNWQDIPVWPQLARTALLRIEVQ